MTTSDRYWFTGVGTAAAVFAALDVWRDHQGDDSTFSCGVRRLVEQAPAGKYVLAAGLAATAVGFYRHIVRPIAAAVADSTLLD